MKTSSVLSAIIVTLLFFTVNTVSAHHPTIAAEAVCDPATGEAEIKYTSTSWSNNGAEGENSQIDILINDVLVATGAYADPVYSFSGSHPLPTAVAGDIVVVTALAVDDWGTGAPGGQSESVSVTIPSLDCKPDDALGRFTGGGHVIVDGVRITRGLTIHCDLLLSNNLQINWNGNRFHTTEHLTTIACIDDPEIIQAPPRAPLDTLIGTGTGRYNGEDAYSIEYTLVDGGEPGRFVDMIAILIKAPDDSIVLEVPLQVITGGNLQAHFDQPHGNLPQPPSLP
jgi:hypothetical protein